LKSMISPCQSMVIKQSMSRSGITFFTFHRLPVSRGRQAGRRFTLFSASGWRAFVIITLNPWRAANPPLQRYRTIRPWSGRGKWVGPRKGGH
jgi:hypothetical protein